MSPLGPVPKPGRSEPRLAAVGGARDAEPIACHHRTAAPVPQGVLGRERTTGRTLLLRGALSVSVREQVRAYLEGSACSGGCVWLCASVGFLPLCSSDPGVIELYFGSSRARRVWRE